MPEKTSAKRKKPKKQIATVNPLSVRVGDSILCVIGGGTAIGKVISAVNLPVGNNAKNRRFRWRFSLEFAGELGTFRKVIPHTLFIRKCNSNDIKDLWYFALDGIDHLELQYSARYASFLASFDNQLTLFPAFRKDCGIFYVQRFRPNASAHTTLDRDFCVTFFVTLAFSRLKSSKSRFKPWPILSLFKKARSARRVVFGRDLFWAFDDSIHNVVILRHSTFTIKNSEESFWAVTYFGRAKLSKGTKCPKSPPNSCPILSLLYSSLCLFY